MIRVGLTGGIATGKSAVAAALRSRGIPVLDADQVAREIVSPGSPGLASIVSHFGPSVLASDQTLDRAALRAIVLSDPVARAALEAITHPLIQASIRDWLEGCEATGHTAAVVEAALLIETGSHQSYDLLVVVSCDADTQQRRLMARNNIDSDEAARWVATQMPVDEKVEKADIHINNDGPIDALAAQLDELMRHLRRPHLQ